MKDRATGAWVPIDDDPPEDWECNNCGYTIYGVEDPEEYKFCPNCGAEMCA